MKIRLSESLKKLLGDSARVAMKVDNLRGPGIDNKPDTLSINVTTAPASGGVSDSSDPTSNNVSLNQVGGSQGSSSTARSWTYDVTLPDATVYAAADVTIAFQRSNGRYTSGVVGMGYVHPDDDTKFVLTYADEVPFTAECPPPP